MTPTATYPFFPDNTEFWFEAQRALGAASYGGSESGEVMAILSRITSGDYNGWYDEWNAAAERIFAEAEAQRAAGHRVSARDGYLRATTYFRNSEFFLHGNHDDPRIDSAYRKSIAAYKLCCSLYDVPILPVEIPYENTTLPGYFHRVDESDTKRPLLILHTGFDGSAEEMHGEGARAGVERGWNVLTFDGPGQYGPIHRERMPFRPDWEKAVTPAVDFALTLPGVDPAKIALMGVSMGGYLAPRAAAFEKRISALVANDGIYDFGVTQTASIPPAQLEAFLAAVNQKDNPELDRKIAEGLKNAGPDAKWGADQAGFVMGESTPHAIVAKMLKFNLRDGVAEQISCPTLVLASEEDQYLKGQPDELFAHLTCPKTIIRFTSAEGAGAHCQCGADRLANARIFDWLDDSFGLAAKPQSPANAGAPSKTQTDPRLDPRIKKCFAAMPAPLEKPNVASREELLAQENSPAALAALKQQTAFFDSMDSEAIAPSAGLRLSVETLTSSPDGNTIKIRYVRPDNSEILPCVYYIHGGRMEMSSCFEGNYKTWARMLAAMDVAVAMVEFRNSVHPSEVPEIAPFPAGLNDCISGLKWVHANAGALNIDPQRIIVAGESGGGNLTFAVGMKLKQDGDVGLIAGLYSLCPYIAGEWPLPEYPSTTESEGIVLNFQDNRATMAYGIEAFNDRNPLAWPRFAKRQDVEGLPPTVVSVNECDPLRDEGIAFYRLLMDSGVSARCRQMMGACHGVELLLPAVCPDIARSTARDIADFAIGA